MRAICQHCGRDITHAIRPSSEDGGINCLWPEWCPVCRHDPLEKTQPHNNPRPYFRPDQLELTWA